MQSTVRTTEVGAKFARAVCTTADVSSDAIQEQIECHVKALEPMKLLATFQLDKARLESRDDVDKQTKQKSS